MCGLAGILTNQPELDVSPRLDAMLRALRHRGPDDEGTGEVALTGRFRLGMVHTRLAILDLSPAGHQPMQDPASGSWIIYNGEVYNHQEVRRHLPNVAFSSSCDTETILKAWVAEGERSLDWLRGMFAFGLWDAPRQRFWLVRDRLGIKPLYVYRVNAGTWIFGSEVRTLLASGLLPRRLDPRALDAYFAFGAVPAPWTMLAGVESLLPAEAWCFDLSLASRAPEPRRTQYWQPNFEPASGPALNRDEVLERLRPELLDSVALRMVSDVPVGVFLSGGIDSSAVVAALAAQGHRLHTFSVVFRERQFDESEHARMVADRFNTQHTELLLEPASMLVDYDKAVAAYDQPSVDGVNTYFISQAVRRAGIKVALSGLGGDELFAGYPYFRRLARLERGWMRWLAGALFQVLRRTSPRSVRTIKLGALLQGEQSRLARYAVCRQVMAPDQRESLLSQPGAAAPVPLPPRVAEILAQQVAGLDAINAHSLLECSLYMANMLLRDLDQMSMAHALEVREPLLDHRLVETVARIPGGLKLAPGRRGRVKPLLLDALPTELPPAIHRRRKMGFVLPWEQWLRGELRTWVSAVLTDRDSLQASGLEAVAVEKLWQDFLAGRPGTRYTDVLCLAHLLHWVKQHGLAVGGG